MRFLIHKVICNKCNKQCIVDVYKYEDTLEFLGNQCDLGIEYAKEDINNTKKIFTSLVRIKGSRTNNVVSVKSSAPIEKSLWIECSKALSRIYVGAPIKIGDIVCKNILNTGVNILCTKNIKRD